MDRSKKRVFILQRAKALLERGCSILKSNSQVACYASSLNIGADSGTGEKKMFASSKLYTQVPGQSSLLLAIQVQHFLVMDILEHPIILLGACGIKTLKAFCS
ncbi:hypothetical protein SLEP1_g48391 [Rubroshorea leprosula]|uniref:Uncharacterized protein n=1 Tax=Rubroshorea leprosula TaxID=152421 RepID=A0AAV5LVK2_9ROSI|nr:hypothetical protein SLEP1_g48391 [Rubroshorea leprosula]